MIVSLLSLLAGMVLGQRFKVLVLIPAMGLALLVVTCEGVAHAQGFGPTVVMAVAAMVSLQIGYLAGIGIRHAQVAARAGALRSAFQAGSEATTRGARSAL